MTTAQSNLVLDRRLIMILFCFYFSAVSLTVADLSSVKITEFTLLGYNFIVPAGTIAFAFTFICTDVAIELSNRFTAIVLLVQTLFVRLLAVAYVIWVVGGADGQMEPFQNPPFWTADQQNSMAFVLSGTVPIYVAGFLAIFLGFAFDIYVYSYLRERQRGRNTYWWRNAFATSLGQIVNSVIFITIAFAATLTASEIISAIFGMVVVKVFLAFIDPAFAVMMRNWGEGRSEWWAFWKRNLRVDLENYVPSTR